MSINHNKPIWRVALGKCAAQAFPKNKVPLYRGSHFRQEASRDLKFLHDLNNDLNGHQKNFHHFSMFRSGFMANFMRTCKKCLKMPPNAEKFPQKMCSNFGRRQFPTYSYSKNRFPVTKMVYNRRIF